MMGDTEFESVTSTMSTFERSIQNTVNHGTNRDGRKRLHQWLHQISELSQRLIGFMGGPKPRRSTARMADSRGD